MSVPVLLHLLALLPSLERGLVMVQSEVADRLAARPGSKVYGIPSVKAAWFADVRRAGAIGRNVFWPAPNVDSGLVAWTRREPPTTAVTREQVFAVVDAAFAQRRKALRPALRGLAGSAEALRARPRGGRHRPDDARRAAAAARLRADRGGPRGTSDAMSVTVRAPAKVNLALVVGRPREDGYHPLNTVYQAISLYDDVRVSDADEWSVGVDPIGEVDCSGVPLDETNIVVRAGRLLVAHHGLDLAADIEIQQGHPGRRRPGRRQRRRGRDAGRPRPALGPADHRRGPARARRRSSAATCPFALIGGSAHGVGHGELVTPVPDRGSYWWVVVPSDEGLSTPAVYREFDRLHPDVAPAPT